MVTRRGGLEEVEIEVGRRDIEVSRQHQHQHRSLLLPFLLVAYRSYHLYPDRIRGLVSQVEAEVGAEADHRDKTEEALTYLESDAGVWSDRTF